MPSPTPGGQGDPDRLVDPAELLDGDAQAGEVALALAGASPVLLGHDETEEAELAHLGDEVGRGSGSPRPTSRCGERPPSRRSRGRPCGSPRAPGSARTCLSFHDYPATRVFRGQSGAEPLTVDAYVNVKQDQVHDKWPDLDDRPDRRRVRRDASRRSPLRGPRPHHPRAAGDPAPLPPAGPDPAQPHPARQAAGLPARGDPHHHRPVRRTAGPARASSSTCSARSTCAAPTSSSGSRTSRTRSPSSASSHAGARPTWTALTARNRPLSGHEAKPSVMTTPCLAFGRA